MADRFALWDLVKKNYDLTGDPHKALRWAAMEKQREDKRLEDLRRQADMLAALSVLKVMERRLL